MEKVYIVAAQRTPIGKFGGALSSKSAIDLGVLHICKCQIDKLKIISCDDLC